MTGPTGAALAPLRERYTHWLGLDDDQVPADREEAGEDIRAMQLILRMERDRPAVLASARWPWPGERDRAVPGRARRAGRGVVRRGHRLLPGHIRKVTRRARAGHWAAVDELPGITLPSDGTEVRALLPGPVADLDKRVARLQVGGTDAPVDEPLPVERRRRLLPVCIPPEPAMTLGKPMAQAGHAGMIAAALLAGDDPARSGLVAAGLPVRSTGGRRRNGQAAGRGRRSREAWADRLVAVRDAGFTEIDPGTITVIARAPGRPDPSSNRNCPIFSILRGSVSSMAAVVPAVPGVRSARLAEDPPAGERRNPQQALRIGHQTERRRAPRGLRPERLGPRVGAPVVGDVVQPDWVPIGCRRITGRTPDPCSGNTSRLDRGVQRRDPGRTRAASGQPAEDPAGHRARVVPLCARGPVHPRTVRPPVVPGVTRLVGPVRVVRQAELVARPDHRDAAPAEDDQMGEQDPGDGRSTASASSPADARPASAAAVPLIRRSPVCGLYWNTNPRAGLTRETPGVPVGQEVPVRRPGQPDRRGVVVVDGPADVVVAADVGHPGRRRRFRR